ncbi:MAG: hypothetical protein QXO70_04175 [Candidatus Pacearchaeota archaeon]
MKSATAKKSKSKSKKEIPIKKQATTKFMLWCIKHNITQRQIKRDTNLSIGTIHSMWYKGKANASNIKLIALVYSLDEDKVSKMIHEFDNTNPIED